MPRRPALRLAPTYGFVDATHDAYVNPLELRRLAKQHGRYWSFHLQPTTVALPGNRFAKSLQSFTHHTNEEQFRELLAEYQVAGVPRPGGYADVFHERFKSPRVNHSVNALLAPAFAGGWQAALSIGLHRDTFYKYDMRSAYLWAATLGLPDVRTYTRSISPWRARKYDGVYRVRLMEPVPGAPFPFDRATECLASNQEIETYGLRISQVLAGVIWKRTLPADKLLEAIMAVSTWKLAGRAYWGRWAQMQRVQCAAGLRYDEHGKIISGKRWYLPNMALNIPWAHMIVSRVKMRLWEYSSKALHVYVDSVITPEQLPTGTGLGDWKLEATYDTGVMIRGPGQYGAPDKPLERMAGVRKDSPRRGNSAAVA